MRDSPKQCSYKPGCILSLGSNIVSLIDMEIAKEVLGAGCERNGATVARLFGKVQYV